jgi:RNA polymerase sigma-70 factor, ECF subfamily
MIGPALRGPARGRPRGDEHAFGVLYRDLRPSVLRYLRVLAPGAAEDLAAETWLRVVRQLGRFGGAEPAFRAWVFLIARHRAIDWRRLAVRRQTDPVPVEALVEQWAADDPAASALEAIST